VGSDESGVDSGFHSLQMYQSLRVSRMYFDQRSD